MGDPDTETKVCVACRSIIDKEAKKCSKCQSFQTWRRHLDATNATVALLVAFVSIIPFFIARIGELLPKRPDVVVAVAGADRTVIPVIAYNSGTGAGGISPIAKVTATSGESDLEIVIKIEDRNEPGFALSPGETKNFIIADAYEFLRTPGGIEDCKLHYTTIDPIRDLEHEGSVRFKCPGPPAPGKL